MRPPPPPPPSLSLLLSKHAVRMCGKGCEGSGGGRGLHCHFKQPGVGMVWAWSGAGRAGHELGWLDGRVNFLGPQHQSQRAKEPGGGAGSGGWSLERARLDRGGRIRSAGRHAGGGVRVRISVRWIATQAHGRPGPEEAAPTRARLAGGSAPSCSHQRQVGPAMQCGGCNGTAGVAVEDKVGKELALQPFRTNLPAMSA